MLPAAVATSAGDAGFGLAIGKAGILILKGVGRGWVAGTLARNDLMRATAADEIWWSKAYWNIGTYDAAWATAEHMATTTWGNTMASLVTSVSWRSWVPGVATFTAWDDVGTAC